MAGWRWQSLFAESSLGYQSLETLKQLMADFSLDGVISEAKELHSGDCLNHFLRALSDSELANFLEER